MVAQNWSLYEGYEFAFYSRDFQLVRRIFCVNMWWASLQVFIVHRLKTTGLNHDYYFMWLSWQQQQQLPKYFHSESIRIVSPVKLKCCCRCATFKAIFQLFTLCLFPPFLSSTFTFLISFFLQFADYVNKDLSFLINQLVI